MSIWETIAAPIVRIIDKVAPDRAAADAAKAQFTSMVAAGELTVELEQLKAVTSAQSDVNKIEAASASWWVAGARPGIMWVCFVALLSDFVVRPYLLAAGVHVPALDMNELMPLLFGMLGLGGYRTVEKIKGVQNQH